MKPSPIHILLDSNERGSDRAKALALAVGGDPAYELAGFEDLPVDMQLSPRMDDYCIRHGCEECSCIKVVNVELKEIPDFWASKASGHLGTQILSMISEGNPGFVAVFGSLSEVLKEVPKVKMGEGKPKRRSQIDVLQDLNTARAFSADACGANVPVHFLSTNHEQSFRWILSYAKNILQGPNLSSWLPRFSAEPQGYGCLCAIPGIGDVAAKAVLAEYETLAALATDCKLAPAEIAKVKVGGKSLGKAKANAIIRAFGCEGIA